MVWTRLAFARKRRRGKRGRDRTPRLWDGENKKSTRTAEFQTEIRPRGCKFCRTTSKKGKNARREGEKEISGKGIGNKGGTGTCRKRGEASSRS